MSLYCILTWMIYFNLKRWICLSTLTWADLPSLEGWSCTQFNQSIMRRHYLTIEDEFALFLTWLIYFNLKRWIWLSSLTWADLASLKGWSCTQFRSIMKRHYLTTEDEFALHFNLDDIYLNLIRWIWLSSLTWADLPILEGWSCSLTKAPLCGIISHRGWVSTEF